MKACPRLKVSKKKQKKTVVHIFFTLKKVHQRKDRKDQKKQVKSNFKETGLPFFDRNPEEQKVRQGKGEVRATVFPRLERAIHGEALHQHN